MTLNELIKNTIDIATANVCFAMESYLNKLSEILNYNVTEDYQDEIIFESFEIFTESTNRRKTADKIDQWIEKKSLGSVHSKNPLYAKRARSLRNFLLMNEFDPNDETIKVVGKNKRVKLILGHAGEHTFHVPMFQKTPDESIGMNTYEMRTAKQNARQFTFGHESGHSAVIYYDPQINRWLFRDPSNAAQKHIDSAIRNGKYITDHDKSPDELDADLYSVQNSRLRTKYAGSKRAVKRSNATRKFNQADIDSSFGNFNRNRKHKQLMELKRAKLEIKQTLDNLRKLSKNNKNKFNVENVIHKLKSNGEINKADLQKLIDDSYEIFNIYHSYLRNCEYKLNKCRDELKTLTDVNNVMKKQINQLENDIDQHINSLRKLSMRDKPDIEIKGADFKDNGNTYIVNKNGINEIMKLCELMKFRDEINDLVNKINITIKKIDLLINKADANFVKQYDIKSDTNNDESVQMRKEFVKKYYHEFFEYYINELHHGRG